MGTAAAALLLTAFFLAALLLTAFFLTAAAVVAFMIALVIALMLNLVLTFMTAAAASTAIIASSTGQNLGTAEAQAYRKSGTGEDKFIFHKEGKFGLFLILQI